MAQLRHRCRLAFLLDQGRSHGAVCEARGKLSRCVRRRIIRVGDGQSLLRETDALFPVPGFSALRVGMRHQYQCGQVLGILIQHSLSIADGIACILQALQSQNGEFGDLVLIFRIGKRIVKLLDVLHALPGVRLGCDHVVSQGLQIFIGRLVNAAFFGIGGFILQIAHVGRFRVAADSPIRRAAARGIFEDLRALL